jgi:Zn-dependent protease
VVPLDGGRAMAALSPWMWFVGLAAFAVLALVAPNPIILIILVVGGLDTFRRFKAYRAGGGRSQPYYAVSPRDRALVLVVYLGLIAALVVGMDLTFVQRGFGDV